MPQADRRLRDADAKRQQQARHGPVARRVAVILSGVKLKTGIFLAIAALLVMSPGALAADDPSGGGPESQPGITCDEPGGEPCADSGGSADDPEPPACKPTAHGSKICIVDPPDDPPVVDPPPVDPPCSVDPDTGEQTCPAPPEVCAVAKFATGEDALAAGCLAPPSCDAPEGAECGLPPQPCTSDEAGNPICMVYDLPGDGVGVCVVGVKSPCNRSGTGPRPKTRVKPKRKPVAKNRRPAGGTPAAQRKAGRKRGAKPVSSNRKATKKAAGKRRPGPKSGKLLDGKRGSAQRTGTPKAA